MNKPLLADVTGDWVKATQSAVDYFGVDVDDKVKIKGKVVFFKKFKTMNNVSIRTEEGHRVLINTKKEFELNDELNVSGVVKEVNAATTRRDASYRIVKSKIS